MKLTEAGTAEMRALIFELRPESLEQESLVTALSKQAAALKARHQLEIRTDFCDEPDLPPATKEALYRVTQEALNNAVKHAKASRVALELACNEDASRLRISDNGLGFDTSKTFPGHLGLTSMRERIEAVAGRLSVESRPGKGTRLEVTIPLG